MGHDRCFLQHTRRPHSRRLFSQFPLSPCFFQSALFQTQSVSKLSEAAQRAIDPTLPRTDVVAKIGTTEVHRSKLRRLFIGQSLTLDMWLDTVVINFYLDRLMDKANAHRELFKLYCFSSPFFQSTNPNSLARRVNFLTWI